MPILLKLGCWLMIIGLAACAPAVGPNATRSPLPATSPLAVPATSPSAPQGLLIRYHRSGGIAGSDETWSIYADGRVEHSGRGTGHSAQLGADQVTTLIAAMRAADAAALKESYVPSNQCCDRFLYEITLVLDGQTQTVRTLDAAPEEPPALTALLSAINAALK